jgi:hypothetical protein
MLPKLVEETEDIRGTNDVVCGPDAAAAAESERFLPAAPRIADFDAINGKKVVYVS